MSFAHQIKLEILAQDFSPEQAYAIISGLVTSAAMRDGSRYLVKINRSDIAKIVRDMISQLEIDYSHSDKNHNWIVLENFKLTDQFNLPGYFFAGVFLGGGSIAKPQSTSYHLEIAFYAHQQARLVQNFLNRYAFNFTLIQRRSTHVLYLKKAEQISDFLKAIQAFRSLIYFEDERIKRDFTNQLNRYSNLDIYNQKKLAKASQKFQEKYLYLKQKNLLHHFRYEEIAFFELKLKNPYSSLAQLSKLFERKTKLKKTRSAFNHYLIKLRNVYEKESLM